MATKTTKKATSTTKAPKAKAPVPKASTKAPAQKAKTASAPRAKKHSKVFLFVREFLEESGNSKAVNAWDENESKLNKVLKNQEKTLERKKKDPNAPKKPQSAYLIFCNDNRSKVKEENPDIKATDVMKRLSEMWKDVKEDKKKSQIYIKKAEKAKEEYLKAMEKYTPPPGFGKKKEPKVKRAPTGYIIFCNDNRSRVKEENPDFKTTDVMKELGRLWSSLEAGEKQSYLDKAAEAKAAMGGEATPAPKGKKTPPPKVEEEDDEDDEEELDEDDDE